MERSPVFIPSIIGSGGLIPYSIKKGSVPIQFFRVTSSLYPSWVREWAFILNSLGMESRPSPEVEHLGDSLSNLSHAFIDSRIDVCQVVSQAGCLVLSSSSERREHSIMSDFEHSILPIMDEGYAEA